MKYFAKQRFFFSLFILVLFLILTTPVWAADQLSVAPQVNNTDNLIGANNASWVFTATTTGQINEDALVKIQLPLVNQAVPFGIGMPAVTASSSIVLVTSTSTHSLGVSAQGIPGGGAVIYGFASSTVPAGTTFSVRVNGINNAQGQLAQMQNLTWHMEAGSSTDLMQPATSPLIDQFSASSSAFNLVRAGGALVSDDNSKISLSSNAVGAANVTYSFTIKTTTSLNVGDKIVVIFPSTYDIDMATSTPTTQSVDDTTPGAQIAVGAVATSSDPGGGGMKRVFFTISNAGITGGDVITVKVAGITNPSSADVYRPFSVFTTRSNSGLVDGSYFGFEPSDFTYGAPSPNDTVYIGGDNTLVVQVLKSNGSGGTTALSPSDISQIKVAAGCPDRQYFMGQQWLDSNGIAKYQNILDCNYMVGAEPFSATSTSFFGSYLPPGMKQVNLVSSGGVGQTATTTLIFGIPDSTSTVEVDLPNVVSGAHAFVQAYSADNQSFSPIYTTPTGITQGFDNTTGKGYARINIDSGKTWNFNVIGGQFGASGNITDGAGNKYWPPDLSSINLTSASSSANLGTFTYVLADKILNVTLQDTNTNPINNACVGVSRSGGGVFMGPQDMICSPNNGNAYQFKVPAGTVTIDVSLPGHGVPAEYPVAIVGNTTNKSITIAAPSTYIQVLVKTSDGTVIKGAPVFANGSNGFGNAMTDSNGAAKIYVPSGTYSVQGFAPGFGPLTAVTTSTGSATTTFSVDTGLLKTISGRITVGGVGVAGINVGAHGTGATQGGNGAQTDSDGYYTLYVPAGTYEVSGWSPSTGGLSPLTVDVSSSDASGKNWALTAQGTLHLTIQNASNLDSLYAGVFDPITGQGNGTNSWTASGTDKVADITVPQGIYTVQVGSPGLGQFGSQTGKNISGSTSLTFDATALTTLATLHGSVKAGGNGVKGVNVWASRTDSAGFFSTVTDGNGDYSLFVPVNASYDVGVRSQSYIPDQGDVVVAVFGDTTQDFTLTSAASTISGKVVDGSGNGIARAWVNAVQTGVASSTAIGTQADDAGNYSLNVSPASTWSLTAQAACYPLGAAVPASASDSSKNITLTAQNGCVQPTPTVYAITDTTGGQISTPNITINIPPNALGTSQQTDMVKIYDTPISAVAAGNSATPMTGSVREIVATDPSGQPITKLNGMVSITTKYDPAAIPAGMSASDLQFGYFDTGTGQWEPIAAAVDTTNHTFTIQVNHFTEDGPILPGVPVAPTGLAATPASASSISLSWIASPSATSYTIYRSTTDSNFTSSIATGVIGTTYSDTGLSANTQYYYEVAGVNSKGEGQNSSSASATTKAAGTTPAGESVSSGGGGLVSISANSTSTTTSPVSPGTPGFKVNPASVYVFSGYLNLGLHGQEVKALQELLQSLGYYHYPSITGYFGAVTKEAVKAFQQAKGITPANGFVGPKTIASLNQLSSSTNANPASSNPENSNLSNLYPSLTTNLKRGEKGKEVELLQSILKNLGYLKVAPTGYFGSLTEAAVKAYQKAEGISAIGEVGPLTRRLLNGSDSPAIPQSETSLKVGTNTENQTQLINTLRAELEKLQASLLELRAKQK